MPRRRANAPGPATESEAPMQPEPNRVEHQAQPSDNAVGDGDSCATRSPSQALDPRIVQIRDEVMRAAWLGAVAALDKATDDDLARVAAVDGIAGEAAQWLVEYRLRDTERRRRMQEALHGWRRNGGRI